jgi:hypothetical protein
VYSDYLVVFDSRERNWSWFKENYDDLVRRFDGEFVAVFECTVVDHDKDLSRLVSRIRKNLSRVLVEYVTSRKIVLVL